MNGDVLLAFGAARPCAEQSLLAAEILWWKSSSRRQLCCTGGVTAAVKAEPRLVFAGVALLMFLAEIKAVLSY